MDLASPKIVAIIVTNTNSNRSKTLVMVIVGAKGAAADNFHSFAPKDLPSEKI